jgi:exopolysaccharide biosynthesis polyprenyl glycosylphosphotransferase
VTHDRQLERVFFLFDVLVLLLAMLASYSIREGAAHLFPALEHAAPSWDYVRLLIVFIPTWGWCANRRGVYRVETLTKPLFESVRAVIATQAWAAAGLAVLLVATRIELNRSFLLLFLIVSTLFFLAGIALERVWLRAERGRNLALVVGARDPDLEGELVRLRGTHVEWLEEIDADALKKRLHTGGVDEVIVPAAVGRAQLPTLLRACDELGIPARVRMDRVEPDLPRPRAELFGPALYLLYQSRAPDRPALLVKAIFDRVAAALALVVLAPLLILIALLIRLTSRGPALFVQQRGGLNGRPFPVLKFRTMRTGAEAERDQLLAANEMDGPVFKIADDPRVTGMGRILRKTSLDELPQLLNVVAGQMSLVGPRPLPLVETRELLGADRRRLSMRPGITCLWQVSGRSDLKFREWMALDLQYVDNWTLALDLAILFRTIPALLSGRGAR